MTTSKTIRSTLVATCCVFASLLLAQTSDKRDANPTVVYIVRHAEKTGELPNADLSAEGRTRAEVLMWMLRDIAFDAVYSTAAPRTLHTVEPIAEAKGLSVEFYVPKPGILARTIQRQGTGKTILVGGHSNTIPVLLKSLGVPIEEEMLRGYDDLFVVTLVTSNTGAIKASLQRLHYPGRR